jgi:hypothetical protein
MGIEWFPSKNIQPVEASMSLKRFVLSGIAVFGLFACPVAAAAVPNP